MADLTHKQIRQLPILTSEITVDVVPQEDPTTVVLSIGRPDYRMLPCCPHERLLAHTADHFAFSAPFSLFSTRAGRRRLRHTGPICVKEMKLPT